MRSIPVCSLLVSQHSALDPRERRRVQYPRRLPRILPPRGTTTLSFHQHFPVKIYLITWRREARSLSTAPTAHPYHSLPCEELKTELTDATTPATYYSCCWATATTMVFRSRSSRGLWWIAGGGKLMWWLLITDDKETVSLTGSNEGTGPAQHLVAPWYKL